MNVNRGLLATIGIAALMVIGVACGDARSPDSPTQVAAQSTAIPSGGSEEGAPRASLTYAGTVYYQDPLSTEEAAALNENDVELVGSTVESNLLPPGSAESLKIYRLKSGETDHVYTLAPGQSFQNEDGGTITIEPEWVRWVASDQNTPVLSGSMLPRHGSVEELVARSEVIVVGTIMRVVEEMRMGGYGEDGQPLPAGEDGLPFTDYEVRIEGLLKGDGPIEQDETLLLRMFGHLSSPNTIITLNVFTLPQPGDHLLFALGINPDGTYGSGPEGLLNIDGERVSYADGAPFAVDVLPAQLTEDIWDVANGVTSEGGDRSGVQTTVEPRGPFDATWVEVTVLSVQDDVAEIRVEGIRDYFRYQYATYPALSVGDELSVTVYSTSALAAVGTGTVVQGVRAGEVTAIIAQPALAEGGTYLADMSACFSGDVEGLSCAYEGWSAAIYPLQQASVPIAVERESATPRPPTGDPEPAVLLSEGEALLRDAQSYADDNDVSRDEGVGRLALQDPIGDLNAELALRERDTFAGLWVEHSPTYRVVVLFTRDAEDTLRPYVAGGPLADIVEVGTANATLVDLESAQAAANRAVADLGIRFGSATNVKTNLVELYVASPEALDEALREASVRLPDHVTVVKVEVEETTGTDVESPA